MIGQTISHYKITAKLGEGGMGEVYLATDTRLDRTVALKFLPSAVADDLDARARLLREAQAASRLNHSNILSIHAVEEADGRDFIVMEYVEGQTLKELIRQGKLGFDRVLDLALQIGAGLTAAHGAGVIHRDIKPDNVKVTPAGLVKIMDFGLATWRGATRLTAEGSTVGTVAYTSPEQAQGKDIDDRSDIFSLGAVLYEMITGRLPFPGDHEAAIIYAIVNDQPQPLARYRATVPDALQRIVGKCLAKSPDERYQSAADLVADLRTLQRVQGTLGAGLPQSRPRGRRRTVAAASVLGVAILAVAAALVTRHFLSAGSGKPSERKMLAVLPFENLGSPDQEYFADGITDEIIGKLASIRDLGVISRTSTMQYKKTTKNLRVVARELGVDYILEGTILWDRSRDTNRVRILPQLIRMSDDTHLWAETYQRPLVDIFAVQADIATRIAEAMDITLLGPEHAALEAMPTKNLDAYQAYLRGVDCERGADFGLREKVLSAVHMFQRAVELDSTFALAYAHLAHAHAGMFHYGFDPTPERLAQAKTAADRALALRPDLPWVHWALCYYYYWGHRDYDRAVEEITLAEAGLPNDPEILGTKAYIWRRQGKLKAAVEQMQKAFVLDPRNAGLTFTIGETFMQEREYASADKFFDRTISLSPDELTGYLLKVQNRLAWRADTAMSRAVLVSIPKPDEEAVRLRWFLLNLLERDYSKALTQLTSLPPLPEPDQMRFIPRSQYAGLVYYHMNDLDRARACFDSARVILEKQLKERPDDHRIHSSLGVVYAGLGRKEDAIREGKFGVDLFPVKKDAYIGPARVEDLALVYIMVGEYDAALDQIEYLLSIPSWISVSLLRLDPRYDPLRKLPRFQKLLQQPDKVF
jgi:non-specific serine/threonine protein kinase